MSVLLRRQLACLAGCRGLAGAAPRAALAARRGNSSLIDCSKLYVKRDKWGGAGAFAALDIRAGDLVEKGIVRRLPVDGNVSPFVFTWSEDRSVWATGSGASVYYNASLDGGENTEMTRHFADDRFEIHATRDIRQHEEVTHLYKSIEWRECFRDLKALREAAATKPPAAVTAQELEASARLENLMECSKVYLKKDAFGGVGAFAAAPIKKGELIEKAVVRRLPVDGNLCPFVFTWGEDRKTFASGSGCSIFYNTSLDGSDNVDSKRFYDEDRLEMYAMRDIKQDEELLIPYHSIEWRECFQELKQARDGRQK